MNTLRLRAGVAGVLTALVALPAFAAAPASAADEVIRQGNCSGSADWTPKAKHRDGGLEVELEVDSNRRGQTWRWTLRHNGSVSSRGTAVTQGPSGSFSRERRMVNLRGKDRISLYARNVKSGQSCSGTLSI